eukprot:c4507_g1_i2.p1 GENE.c4507_g1_i2~~c4507_g1_i2.p1  ORF type:complete len:271 (+),score=44.16 c4507_g1_i2:421-1233(+)
MPLIFSYWGSSADYLCIDASLVAKVPPSYTSQIGRIKECATLPLVGLTVLQAMQPVVDSFETTKGKKILIQAGAGGVGSFAIQYCKHVLGMFVATTCSASNESFVKSLGADLVIDYTSERFEDKVQNYDVVLDALAYLYEARTLNSQVLAPSHDAHYIHIASSAWQASDNDKDLFRLGIPEAKPAALAVGALKTILRTSIRLIDKTRPKVHGPIFVHPDGEGMQEIARVLESGLVRPVVSRVFDITCLAEAHAYVEAGHSQGKVLISIAE